MIKSGGLSILLILCFWGELQSQIFKEDFNSGTALSAWTLIDADGRTPANGVSQFVNAWILTLDSSSADSCASSTSWYNPLGQSDDWMVTPPIALTSSNILSWEGRAQDNRYPDGYEIRISTTNNDTASFLSNPPLFTLAGENATWTRRSLNLQALGYANQTVYLAWRNNSNDQYILHIDNIQIDAISGNNAKMLTAMNIVDQFWQVPFDYANSISLVSAIENAGADTLFNLKTICDVYRNGIHVHTDSSQSIAALAPTDTALFSIPNGFQPSIAGDYHVVYYPRFNGIDNDSSDNFYITDTLSISDSTFARDNGRNTGSIGIGAGIRGELGSMYTINRADTLSSVSIYISNTGGQMTGQPLSINIRNIGGTPTTAIASSDTLVYSSSGGSWVHFSFDRVGGNVPLPAGPFFIGVVEPDSNLTLGTTTRTYTTGVNFIKFPGGISNGWNSLDAYNIRTTLMIRPHFAPTSITVDLASEILTKIKPLVFPNPSNDGIFNLGNIENLKGVSCSVYNLNGRLIKEFRINAGEQKGHFLDLSNEPNGIYFLQINSADKSWISKLIIR